MDLTKTNPVIINACTPSGWYPKGSDRLKRSLNYVGWAGGTMIWKDWPSDEFDKPCPYNIKASAFLEAQRAGASHILWCDSSVWALQDPMPIFDIINEQGYFFWSSGYNCAQTCSDKSLEYFSIKRDEAEHYPDVATGIFGVSLQSDIGTQFLAKWLNAAKDGVFNGSRFHDKQSQDKRFLFHRQDQSAASLICGLMGIKPIDHNSILGYFRHNMPDSWIFTLRGI